MTQYTSRQNEIIQSYRHRIELHGSSIHRLKKNKKFLALARLLSAAAAAAGIWYCWPAGRPVFFISLAFAILFIYLVFRDAHQTALIQKDERLIRINRHELDAMHQTLQGYDDGHDFDVPSHAYASDLDLFGPHSLFQWLSRCHAEQSRLLLASYLKSPLPAEAIPAKQEAVKELAEKQVYCQQFQCLSMASPLTLKTEKNIKLWMYSPPGLFERPVWKWIRNIYPLLSFSVLGLFMTDYISTGYFTFWLIGFFAVSSFISSKINPVYLLLSRIQPEMDAVHEQLRLIEGESFQAPFLQSLKNRLKPNGYNSGAASMHVFHSILKKFDFRMNIVVFVLLNAFLLWDLRQMISLNDWKRKNESRLQDWFEVIAEMEVCISLASLAHNEPAWCFASVDEHYFHFSAKEIAHPLIPADQRVINDFGMEGPGIVALITGSNMAGKSTFLRALGINTVLALMGAPACARDFSLGEVKLISSMRVADNLAENTSTFYAELKKLQYIIESVKRREKVFILLDEVLRGTNSTDRHKGTRALVRQLLESGSVTAMATHDTELAHSESAADDSVFSYYFEGKIVGDELVFDYKIKKGICESLNATMLMKKIGIQFQD